MKINSENVSRKWRWIISKYRDSHAPLVNQKLWRRQCPARGLLHPESWLDNPVTTLQQDAPPRRKMHGIYAWIAFLFMRVYRNRTRLVGYAKLFLQWRKIWGQGQSGQAIELFQITPYVNDFQTLNNPGSWQLIYRRLEKLVLFLIFDTSLSSFMMWNLQSYPTTILNERMRHL